MEAPPLSGVLCSVEDTDAVANAARNGNEYHTVGTKRRRVAPAVDKVVLALDADVGAENLLHTTLHPKGQGDWRKCKGGCSNLHHTKARLCSVNLVFAHADEHTYGKYQSQLKREGHYRE